MHEELNALLLNLRYQFWKTSFAENPYPFGHIKDIFDDENHRYDILISALENAREKYASVFKKIKKSIKRKYGLKETWPRKTVKDRAIKKEHYAESTLTVAKHLPRKNQELRVYLIDAIIQIIIQYVHLNQEQTPPPLSFPAVESTMPVETFKKNQTARFHMAEEAALALLDCFALIPPSSTIRTAQCRWANRGDILQAAAEYSPLVRMYHLIASHENILVKTLRFLLISSIVCITGMVLWFYLQQLLTMTLIPNVLAGLLIVFIMYQAYKLIDELVLIFIPRAYGKELLYFSQEQIAKNEQMLKARFPNHNNEALCHELKTHLANKHRPTPLHSSHIQPAVSPQGLIPDASDNSTSALLTLDKK